MYILRDTVCTCYDEKSKTDINLVVFLRVAVLIAYLKNRHDFDEKDFDVLDMNSSCLIQFLVCIKSMFEVDLYYLLSNWQINIYFIKLTSF